VGSVAALAEGFVEDDGTRGRNVEGADAAGHGNAEQVVAGLADQVVEACAFAAENEDAVAGEVELVVVGGAALVETDDPDVLALEIFKGADEVDDAGYAEVLGGAGAGFYGDWAEGSGTALGQDDAVDACAVGYAKQGAEVLGVFYAVEGKQKAAGVWLLACGEEILDGEELLWADQGDHALMGGGFGHLRQLLAGFLADSDAGLAKGRDEAFETHVFALAGYDHLVEAAAAGLERFFNRVHAVKNFHEG